MKITTILISFLLVGFCCTVNGQWVNFPASQGNSNGYEWAQIRTNWLQLIAATSERTRATGFGSAFWVESIYQVPGGITNISESWYPAGFPDRKANAVYAGTRTSTNAINAFRYTLSGDGVIVGATVLYSNSDSSRTSTNWFYYGTTNRVYGAYTVATNRYTNTFELEQIDLSMTNLDLTPYSYVDETGSNSVIGYPHVTQSEQVALDARIMELIPYFVATNQMSNGNFNAWFNNGTNDFLMWTATNLFTFLNIGIVTNGTASFTRYPLITNQWLLHEVAYDGSWKQRSVGVKPLNDYSTALPVALYNTATNGTNAIGSYNFIISGDVLVISNQSLSADSETITVTSSNTACTKLWHSISSITCASPAANTNDWLSISYTNAHAVYGAAPYELYSADLDERWKVLDALRWTRLSQLPGASSIRFIGKRSTDVFDTYAGAKTEAEGANVGTNDYPSAVIRNYGLGEVAMGVGDPDAGGFWVAAIGWQGKADVISSFAYTNLYPKAYAYYGASTTIAAYYSAATNVITDTVLDLFGNTTVGENKAIYSGTSFEINKASGTTNRVGVFDYTGNHVWPSEPSTSGPDNDEKIRGYQINKVLYLFRWDDSGTNKFKYK